MDGFSGYNQIHNKPKDQHKMDFIFPWGTFAYKKIPFGLKNVGARFQQEMNFSFHDIKSIVKLYLDDLPAHSWKRINRPDHLRLIFERYRHYKICLNPHKCVFCVELGGLLRFIVSNKGIQVDPLICLLLVPSRKFRACKESLTFFGILSWIIPISPKASCACWSRTPHLYGMKPHNLHSRH